VEFYIFRCSIFFPLSSQVKSEPYRWLRPI